MFCVFSPNKLRTPLPDLDGFVCAGMDLLLEEGGERAEADFVVCARGPLKVAESVRIDSVWNDNTRMHSTSTYSTAIYLISIVLLMLW